MGTNERPDRPILRRSLSMTKATRAMYPLSSRIDRKKNSVTMIGIKDNTVPTPAKMPSMTSDCTTGLMPYAVRPASVHFVSHPISSASRSESAAPTTPNVSQKTSSMITIKIGIDRYLCVSMLSIFALRSCSRVSPRFFTTVAAQSSSIYA